MRQYSFLIFFLLPVIMGCSGNEKYTPRENLIEEYIPPNKRAAYHIDFGQSKGVVFTAEYVKKLISKDEKWKQYGTFTPDSLLIRHLYNVLPEQYCNIIVNLAGLKFIKELEQNRDSINGVSKQRTLNKSNKEYLRSFCSAYKQEAIQLDKQFIGIISTNGEKIIVVQLCYFNKKSYHLKPLFDTVWINTQYPPLMNNIVVLFFHVEKNLLTGSENK